MPIVNRIADLHGEIIAWRRDIHAHPELLFDVHRTAASVAEKLKAFGCDEVVTGLGRTGVVGVIRGCKGGGSRVIGLRADMDGLPITEANDLPYKSTVPGKMHACGHDGHTAMLLGAARYLTETRNFAGTAVVIFQPAEEGGGGGREMVKDGMMDRFGVEEVYGMHNYPGLPVGEFAIRPGPMMAATDRIDIDIEGRGGHAAMPHQSIDSVLVGAQIITQLQSIVARNVDPLKSAVVTITTFNAGTAFNIIPETAMLTGTVRTLDPAVRDLCERRIGEIADNVARAYGGSAETKYIRMYPVTMNHAQEAAVAADVARDVVGTERVDDRTMPVMGGEDFAFMLEARPGAFVFLGMGDGNDCHHPAYRFNDNVLGHGASYWVRLIEKTMPAN